MSGFFTSAEQSARYGLAMLAMPALLTMLAMPATPSHAHAQAAHAPQAGPAGDSIRRDGIDAIIRQALRASPAIHAAESRYTASLARIRPVSLQPDPMLMAGLLNQPLGSMKAVTATNGATPMKALPDEMTMKMIGVTQTIIYPGKLQILRRVAEMEATAAQADVDVARLDVERSAKEAYYELVYLDRAIDITARTSDILATVVRATEARYSTGTSAQQDVLKSRVEAARLAETANMLAEQRRTALAQLNAVLDQPTDASLPNPAIPERIVKVAVAHDADQVRFTAMTLGSRAADSPLPSVIDMQNLAIEHNPALRAHDAMTEAQAARVESARNAYKPDFDLTLQYGQRVGRPDMITALVSAPIRLHRKSREDQMVADAASELAALHAEHESQVNTLRADIARLAAEIERNRTQLALYAKAILPQAHATIATSLSSYQNGRTDLLGVLDSESTAFSYELAYDRALSDFAINIAKLEQLIGAEVLK